MQENYIFISYAHKDAGKVLPILERMTKANLQIWYDAGIEAGTEWPEYIEEHLKNAASVVVFMTPNAINSKNCRNEINLALDLDKPILVVYLEETELIKGMRLQLNSTQSLFRKNHTSHEDFLQELINARILQPCRLGAEANVNEMPKSKKSASNRQIIISNICSIGSNDAKNPWPTGVYSNLINRDRFAVVYFHIKLLKNYGMTGTIHCKYQIFNSKEQLIYDSETDVFMQPNYDRLSTGWVLKGADGSYVPSGEYRFECTIENSALFSHIFKVTSDEDDAQRRPQRRSFWDRMKSAFSD